METASKVMYSIANFFTWILVIFCVGGIVCSALIMAHVIPSDANIPFLGLGSLIYTIVVLVFALITISMVRIAKSKNSSKGWDILFLILGILGWNVFYILGGIFGIVAVRR